MVATEAMLAHTVEVVVGHLRLAILTVTQKAAMELHHL
jgi:hypothetical protein